ncbi:MAG TPA: fibronectin type III domain-containing protein [Candidatus Acidoferrum sp.]|nr:fibronectin type III domain-containing protein [Candidatus Acidoferrum sp.]
MRSRLLRPAGLLFAAGVALVDAPGGSLLPDAWAQPNDAACRVVEMEMTPTPDLQIVAWVEDRQGNYVDTAFITRTTGSYGLGNRPGIMEFDSGPWWPYGRRTTTFPVWAERHGQTWPLVVFQDGIDTQLSHPLGESSRERFYCRPIKPDEVLWDATSCASTVYTDKGSLSGDMSSKYPPRSDITFDPAKDHPSVEDMAALNPFDSVSHATPLGDGPYAATWPVPADLPAGDYVLWLEVSREFDQNESYDYPAPDVPWSDYGQPYRGQPSVVYRVDFTLGPDRTVASTLDYVGYGDPDGLDGELRAPDSTITADVPGSGSSRLLVTTDGAQTFRVRVSAYGSEDKIAPEAPGEVGIDELRATEVSARFAAPGDDGLEGTVAGYEVRYLAGREIDEASFAEGTLADFEGNVVAGGEEQSLVVGELLPRTNYSIGVRAYDECANVGPLRVFHVTTPRPEAGAVDACFVATAAYGSLLAGEVSALRVFRDLALRSNVPGELAVESYYTFGPLLARIIAPSDTLRRAARAALAPAVAELHAAGF